MKPAAKTCATLLLLLLSASPLACGKHAKECVSRCEAAAQACVQHHEANCEQRGKRCGERCEHDGDFSF